MVSGIATARPHHALAEHVHRLHGAYAVSEPGRRREAPVPGTALILALEYDWGIAASEDVPLRRVRSFAGGLTLAPAISEDDGRIHCLQVDLSPLGTAAVLGVPGSELAGEIVAFEDLIGERAASELTERLACREGWPARFAALQAWIARRVAAAQPPPPDVAWAVSRLDGSGGRIPVAEVQRELGCSRRHLASRFREHVGCGPKAYGRLVRFDRAVGELRAGTSSLARVAADCGYSDQAHMTREVRAFAGATPSDLRAAARVTSVQAQSAISA